MTTFASALTSKAAGLAKEVIGGPKVPPVQEAPKPPAKEDTAAVAAQTMVEALRRRGRAATILSDQDNLGATPTARKRLLGG